MTRPDIPPPSMTRRAVLMRLAAAGLSIGPATSLVTGCGMRDNRRGPESNGTPPDWMMGEDMMDGEMMADMRVIRDLLAGHQDIEREVEDIERGIRARTVSEDPQLAELIRGHVEAMRIRVEDNRPIRLMDPVFREIFEHHDAIAMEVSEVAGGVQVTETSDDPQVQLLIRQHAHRAVSEFVASGMSRAMEPTPLPDGYRG
jgi:hypothetical protein